MGGGGDAVLHTEPGTWLYFSNVFLPLYFLNYIFLSTFVFIDNIFEKKLTRPHFLFWSLLFHIQTYDMVVFLSDPGLWVRSISLIVSSERVSE